MLIIEPAKDEWVRWAIKQNEHLPESERIHIFEPGLSSFEGTLLSHLMLNPFQPAAIAGAPIDMQTRCEKITALINATLPTGDILPVIIDVYKRQNCMRMSLFRQVELVFSTLSDMMKTSAFIGIIRQVTDGPTHTIKCYITLL